MEIALYCLLIYKIIIIFYHYYIYMSLHIIKNIDPLNCDKFVNMLYINFMNLAQYPNLLHNKTELKRLVTSKNTHIYIIMINNKIVSYLVGEIKKSNDKRTVFYINYLFTAKRFRKQGYGDTLMKYVIKMIQGSNYDGILLTCDT